MVHTALTDTQVGMPLNSQAKMLPRQPTKHFRCNVLGPLHLSATIMGNLSVFYNYVEALLSHLLSQKGILIESAYSSKSFFLVERALVTLFSVESWPMLAQTQNLHRLPGQMLYIYSFLQCLTEFQHHPTLLPPPAHI
jgi:hypothetical protein